MAVADALIDFSKAKVVPSRLDWVAPYIQNGKVLDLGCIDERHPERIISSFHAELKKINPELVGFDADYQAVEKVQKLGFPIRLGHAETDDFGGPYDVIFAGELIEHLNNPGLFLENIRRQLNPAGTLLLTTPNPFYANQFAKILKYGKPQVHQEHRMWFSPETLETLCRAMRFRILECVWFAPQKGLLRRFLAHKRSFWNPSYGMAIRPS